MFYDKKTAEKAADYHARLNELQTVFSQARTAPLRLQIEEEVEEIQGWFLRHRLKVPTFDFMQEYL